MSLRAVSLKINDISSARIRNISYDSNINVKVDAKQDYKVKFAGIIGARRLKNLEDVSASSPQDKERRLDSGLLLTVLLLFLIIL